MRRIANRGVNELRSVAFIPDVSRHAEGSCLVKIGYTHVLCTATFENRVPPFLRGKQSGWVTAEYGMLPRATQTRTEREAFKGKQTGRSHEIQRLIGRSLRTAINLSALGENQIKIDCDVLQADGGTRTASICGAFIALAYALKKVMSSTSCSFLHSPLKEQVSAVSCGIVDGELLLDLDYKEDSNAEVDGNFVFTSRGQIIEAQMTGEKSAITPDQLHEMTKLAAKGCQLLFEHQKQALKGIFE